MDKNIIYKIKDKCPTLIAFIIHAMIVMEYMHSFYIMHVAICYFKKIDEDVKRTLMTKFLVTHNILSECD